MASGHRSYEGERTAYQDGTCPSIPKIGCDGAKPMPVTREKRDEKKVERRGQGRIKERRSFSTKYGDQHEALDECGEGSVGLLYNLRVVI